MRMSDRGPAGGGHVSISADGNEAALTLMEQALALIDAHQGPSDCGAHLDLAIHRLKEWIATHHQITVESIATVRK